VSSAKNFVINAGEDRTLSMVARDANGDILNLTDATIAWRMSLIAGDTSTVSKTGSVVSASAGTFTVSLTDADTDIDEGDYAHQALATISGTTTLCARGIVRIMKTNQA
jgi:hypothetical protein